MEFLPKKLTWRVNLDLPNLVENFFRRRRMEGEQPMKRLRIFQFLSQCGE
jgi:hypothetical protein